MGLGVHTHEEWEWVPGVSSSDHMGLSGYRELALPLPSSCPVLPLALCTLVNWTVSLLKGLKILGSGMWRSPRPPYPPPQVSELWEEG